VGRRGRVSPDNARERVKNEKTRTISSFSIVLLRKSANSVAKAVQIFGQFLTGKITRHEIVVDLNLVRISRPGTPATIPGRAADTRSAVEAPGDDIRMPVIRAPDPRVLYFHMRRRAVEATQ
jgi:hypothetical protein